MEFEDIVKRVEWLDEQQRKAKTALAETSAAATGIQSGLETLTKEYKKISRQLNDLALTAARLEQFEKIIAKHRSDVTSTIEVIEKNSTRRAQETTDLHRAEMEELRKAVFEIRTASAADEKWRKERAHEEQRRNLAMQDLAARIEAIANQSKDLLDAQKSWEQEKRQDAKRFDDLQAELESIRRRSGETREKTTLNADSIRNMENRITELADAEAARQERQAVVAQKQALEQVERDRAWQEWQAQYEGFKEQAHTAETQVALFEESIRAARQAEETYAGLNQKLERRIAEVGEVQRLSEERIRQEWVAFKADEQKRWSGHTLAQDDLTRELRKDNEKADARLTALEDAAQTLEDRFQQTAETTEQQLQQLMNVSQDWLSAYERIMGHAKSKATKPTR